MGAAKGKGAGAGKKTDTKTNDKNKKNNNNNNTKKNNNKKKGNDDDEEEDDKKNTKPVKDGQSIKARHILCAKMSKKDEAKQKLDEGVKFDEVAQTYSEDKARQGGALDWKVRGTLLPEFEKVAYSLPLSTTAKPVYGEAKTTEGYHIIMVEGKK